MSEMKHTPLPWFTDDPWIVAARVDGQITYLANTSDQDTDEKQSEIDAAYIVTACNAFPDLVEALRNLLDATRSHTNAIAHPELTNALAEADAALSKVGQS